MELETLLGIFLETLQELPTNISAIRSTQTYALGIKTRIPNYYLNVEKMVVKIEVFEYCINVVIGSISKVTVLRKYKIELPYLT